MVAALNDGVGVIDFLRRDVILTRAEVAGLFADLLVTWSPPAETKLSEWFRDRLDALGRGYQSGAPLSVSVVARRAAHTAGVRP